MIDTILLEVQYKQRDVMHFRTSYTMKELASSDFLKSLMKMPSKNGSMAFLRASHISTRAIIAFLERVDRRDSTSFKTSGIMAGRCS